MEAEHLLTAVRLSCVPAQSVCMKWEYGLFRGCRVERRGDGDDEDGGWSSTRTAVGMESWQ